MDLDYAMLGHLTQIPGPSGSEERVAEFISALLSPYCDELKTDILGNLIVMRHGTGKENYGGYSYGRNWVDDYPY